MTEKCFLCLLNTNNKVCTTCNVGSHVKCWDKYKKNIYKNNLKCPQCSSIIKGDRVCRSMTTRSMTRHSIKQKSKKVIIKTVNEYLCRCSESDIRYDKMTITMELFNYLVLNIHFVNRYIKFKNTLREKLIFFYEEEKWYDVGEIYESVDIE